MRLNPVPAAPYMGDHNAPQRRTVAEMRAGVMRDHPDARDFAMFRLDSGRAANAFCRFTTPQWPVVVRYHDTDILKIGRDGPGDKYEVEITFGGWHTITTRQRFNAACEFFGLPLACNSIGRQNCTRFITTTRPGASYATQPYNPEIHRIHPQVIDDSNGRPPWQVIRFTLPRI